MKEKSSDAGEQVRPWQKEPFICMLISFPLAAVLGGFVTLYLAIVSYDGLIVDDYYKRGLEINRVLDREQQAQALGLDMTVEIDQLLPFEFEISNTTESEAFVILLLTMDAPGKGRGRRMSRYQIWKGKIQAGDSRRVEKRIHFVDKSTQRKEPGTYRLIVTLNGRVLGERKITFER